MLVLLGILLPHGGIRLVPVEFWVCICCGLLRLGVISLVGTRWGVLWWKPCLCSHLGRLGLKVRAIVLLFCHTKLVKLLVMLLIFLCLFHCICWSLGHWTPWCIPRLLFWVCWGRNFWLLMGRDGCPSQVGRCWKVVCWWSLLLIACCWGVEISCWMLSLLGQMRIGLSLRQCLMWRRCLWWLMGWFHWGLLFWCLIWKFFDSFSLVWCLLFNLAVWRGWVR